MKVTKTVRASKKVAPSAKRPVRASRKAIRADEDFAEDEIIDAPAEDVEDFSDDEAVEEEILFEASDVAEVLAEVTGEPVDYTVDDETTEVTFTVGDDEVTVTPEGDEEVVEESTRVRGRKIAASTRAKRAARKIAASRKTRR